MIKGLGCGDIVGMNKDGRRCETGKTFETQAFSLTLRLVMGFSHHVMVFADHRSCSRSFNDDRHRTARDLTIDELVVLKIMAVWKNY